jgi:hypothetical protein
LHIRVFSKEKYYINIRDIDIEHGFEPKINERGRLTGFIQQDIILNLLKKLPNQLIVREFQKY